MADDRTKEEGFGGGKGGWTAFHQAYDSAVRAHRRGSDVSRAVNWLYVMSRDAATPEEREMERHNRELGLRLGADAKSEVDIAPGIWGAVQRGDLVTRPSGRSGYFSDSSLGPVVVAGDLIKALGEKDDGGEETSPASPGEKELPALPEEPKSPTPPREEEKGKPGEGDRENPDWEYLL